MVGVVVLCTLVLSFCGAGFASDFHWDYKNLDLWPKQCSAGNLQSPIELSSDISTGANFVPFKFSGYDQTYPATIKNNGHSVEIRLNVNTKIPSVSGGGLDSDYVLDSMHFHWESEHVVDDRRFPLELHLVHYDSKKKNLDSAIPAGRVAVLGVLFYTSPDDDVELAPFFDAVRKIEQQKYQVGVPVSITSLELDDLLPRDRAGFYRYKGSLTTPNCTEGVTWTVFTNGLPISNNQLKIFSKLTTRDNEVLISNFRPLQDLNDRTVQLKISGMESQGNSIMTTNMKLFVVLAMLLILL